MEGAEDLSTNGGAPAPSSSAPGLVDGGGVPGADATAPVAEGGTVPEAEDPDFLVKRDAVFVDGAAQRIVVMEPRRPAPGKLPILVAYHGDEGSAELFREQWALHRITGQNAVVVYADDGANASAWGGASMSTGNPFAAGFEKIVQRMTQIYDGDATRVVVAGMSSGGIFASLMACRYSGSTAMTLRAAVVMSGSGPNETQVSERFAVSNFPKRPNQRPVTTLVVHGKADQTPGVGFAEGQWAADYWTYVNRVAAASPVAAQENFGSAATSTPFPGFPAQCRKYDDSPAANPVVFCAIDDLGHTLWADSAPTAWQFANYASP